jgi:hypothetical protein
MTPAEQPIVVCGLDRTGKTALRVALGAHPSLAMARRLDLWTGMYGRFGDLTDDRNARRLADALIGNRHLVHQLVDPNRLVDRILSGPRSYGSAFAELGTQLAQRAGKLRWGEQAALAERQADAIFTAFPEARMIHMLRDPRDRYAAIARSASRRGGVAPATGAWLESVGLAERNERRHPGRYLVLRIEDLLERPEATLRDTCDFAELPFLPSMAEAARAIPGTGKDGGEIGTGIFRDILSRRQVAFIQARAGDQMASRGYDRIPVRLSGVDRVRYWALDTPLNWAAALVWAARERAARAGRQRATAVTPSTAV